MTMAAVRTSKMVGLLLRVFTVQCPLLIALMMEAVRTSELSVYFYETARRYIPEGIVPIV
jgi:hypothetical protein